MFFRDPKCVYVADSTIMAGLVQGWLSGHGFETEVMNEATLGGFEGLNWITPGVSQRGMEVWVVDPSQAEAAKALVAEKAAEIEALQVSRENRTGTVTAVCEECGVASEFPASQMGRTELCPHCQSYLDVPDPNAGPDDEYWRTGGTDEGDG